MLWLAVHHHQRKALELFAMEIASAGTSMGEYNGLLFAITAAWVSIQELFQ